MGDVAIFEREASEHIRSMDKGLDIEPDQQSCAHLHGDTARAIKWIIRQLEPLISKASLVKSDKGHRTVCLPFGIKVPVERGFTFRDIVALLILCAVIYAIFIKEGVV